MGIGRDGTTRGAAGTRPGLAAVAVLAACLRTAEPPAPPTWPSVGPGEGVRAAIDARIELALDRLGFVDAGCGPADGGCAGLIASVPDGAVGVLAARDATIGELSVPLRALREARFAVEPACLLARAPDGRRRCLGVRIFDASDLRAWLDAAAPPAKLRVVLRPDGLEVVAAQGKVPGPDRFGPTLLTRDGATDVAGLADLSAKLSRRFPGEREVALLPSPSIRMEDVARALGAIGGPDGERFDRLVLVVP